MNKTIHHKQMYIFLVLFNVAVAVGFQGWTTLLNNFSVQVAGVNGYEMGVIQSVREIPGFLSLLAIYVLFVFTEQRIVALSTLLLGIGICMTGFLPSYYGIIFSTLVMSTGFHYGQTMNSSLALQSFDKREAPVVLGRLNSAGAVTSIVVGIAIYFLAKFMNYTPMFMLLGGIPIVVGIGLLIYNPQSVHHTLQKKKVVLRKKYWLYYLLTLFDGTRRQISVAFAIFLLVDKFAYSLEAITALFVWNNFVNYFAGRKIGKLINRFGEQRVLAFDYLSLVIVCLVYAFTHNPWIAGAMFIMDNVFYNANVGINTFFQKIARPEEVAASTSVGFTINHIAAVVIPFLGGVLWSLHYSYVFIGGAIVSVAAMLASRLINREVASSHAHKA